MFVAQRYSIYAIISSTTTYHLLRMIAEAGTEERIHDEHVVLLEEDHLGAGVVASAHLVGQLARLAVVVRIVLRMHSTASSHSTIELRNLFLLPVTRTRFVRIVRRIVGA